MAGLALRRAKEVSVFACTIRRMQKTPILLGILLVVDAIQTAYTTSEAVRGPVMRDPWMGGRSRCSWPGEGHENHDIQDLPRSEAEESPGRVRRANFRRIAKIAKTLAPKTLWKITRSCVAVLCSVLLVPGDAMALVPTNVILAAHAQEKAAAASEQTDAKVPPDQLDSLVAPIALYPDPLLAQVLAASTYPLELVQLQQWQDKNKSLKDKALADAVAKQPWDPSVQAMAALPDVVKRLAGDIQWTTELGNAFLDQQGDVMDAVQRMRRKAQGTGNLKSSEQQKVETKTVESKQVIVIEQSNPQVVYVPSYQPTVVYGAPVYPYPPIAYPPPGYYAAGMAISFGVGIAMGAAMGGGWGWGCGWGGGNNNVTINNNNNFNRNTNVNGGNRVSNQPTRGGGAGNSWQHNPQHRGGTPYGNRETAQKFGGTARSDSRANRQAGGRQNIGQQGSGRQASTRQGDGSSRGRQPSAGNRASGGGDRGGGDRGGNRSASSGFGSRSGGGSFGGGSGGMNGSSARASSSRGSSSMGARGGGGGRRGR